MFVALAMTAASMAASAADDGRGHPTHVAGVFLGGTNPDEGNTEFTFGAEYEYRFSQHLGAGLIAERTNDGHDSHHDDGHGHVELVEEDTTVALAAIHYHPTHALRATVGAGREFVEGLDDETLFRLGVAYDIELGENFAIA